eukprot:superscaffoldBa00003331_g16676
MFGSDSTSAPMFNWIRGKSGLIHSQTGRQGGLDEGKNRFLERRLATAEGVGAVSPEISNEGVRATRGLHPSLSDSWRRRRNLPAYACRCPSGAGCVFAAAGFDLLFCAEVLQPSRATVGSDGVEDALRVEEPGTLSLAMAAQRSSEP